MFKRVVRFAVAGHADRYHPGRVRRRRRELVRMTYFLARTSSRRRHGRDGKRRFERDLQERFQNVVRTGSIDSLTLADYRVEIGHRRGRRSRISHRDKSAFPAEHEVVIADLAMSILGQWLRGYLLSSCSRACPRRRNGRPLRWAEWQARTGLAVGIIVVDHHISNLGLGPTVRRQTKYPGPTKPRVDPVITP